MKGKRSITGWLAMVCLVLSTGRLNAQYDASTETKIDALIKQMTLEEKLHMIHGVSSFNSGGVARLRIPELVTSDGPHGVRVEHGRGWTETHDVNDSGTYLPTGNTLAATWNPQLGYAFGSVLGSEAKWRGKDVILGPGINIIRTPLNGRNFEYMSEDPYLISKMVTGYVKGVQDQGISACVKHYMANNQEKDRNTVNVIMSERALREIYLPGFRAAVVDGQVNALMGAYNKFRGQYCTEHEYLVKKILKEEWGFKGVVISDWGAVHNTMEALMNGTDIEMGTDIGSPARPYDNFYMGGDSALMLVKSGKVPESIIDDKVRRILRVMYKTNMFGKRSPGTYATKDHQQTALKVAEEGIVLLKNEDHILPLKKNVHTIAVIGENANRKSSMGGGSSQVKATYEITPLQGLQNLLGNTVQINYARGYQVKRGATADQVLIQEAVKTAAGADEVIFVGGWTHGYNYNVWSDNAYDAEDVDKPDMQMPFGQNELLNAVLKANPNTVVVLMGGGPIDMSQWVNKTKGIVEAWYPGMEGGTAIAKILYGEVNPSGKLPMSFPKHLEDCPAHKLGEYHDGKTDLHYNDDIYVGYRYYDTYHVEPQFPFGYGLSYTSFTFSDIQVAKAGKEATITFTVTNTGKMAGAEVAEVYVKQEKSALPRPEKELKAFEKVYLEPGAHKQVTLTLGEATFQYFDDKQNKWVMEPGAFDVLVGGSSRDIQVKAQVVM